MFLEVSVQICLLTETPVAQWTLEGFLFIMDVPDMSLKIGGYAEGSLAILAFIWLFSGVSSQVTSQICRSGKHFSAEFTGVPLF